DSADGSSVPPFSRRTAGANVSARLQFGHEQNGGRSEPASRSPGSSPLEAAKPVGKPDPLPKANILLVDDRPDKLLAIEAILGSLGQNIVKARSGKEALRCLLQQDFAAILLDVSMPCMDGFETAALIRKRPNSEHTPIIFITSISNSENNVAHGYSLGAVDYLLTPIVPEILRTKVSAFVELYRKSQEVEQLRKLEE